MNLTLSPTQKAAFHGLRSGLERSNIVRLNGGVSYGKTTVLRALHAQTGGAYLSVRDLIAAQAGRDPMGIEDTFFALVDRALETNEIVFVDDASDLLEFTSCSWHYPRQKYINLPFKALGDRADMLGRKLVLECSGEAALGARAYDFRIAQFQPADYGFLCGRFLGEEAAAGIDFARVHRFAPKLDAHQLRMARLWLAPGGVIGTDRFIEHLRSQRLTTNVDLGEVASVDLAALEGVDDVVRSLETYVALPLENDAHSEQMGLRAKRGVLLYGPPGTGKTTVGRALAHRLKGKFLMIDGTFIAGSQEFYQQVNRVFEIARENAPAVIFVDDADAIFEDGEERGLYRYLLTKLDGLESESSGRVCLMMTVMDLEHLPPALVRSGRVELWLEMRLPDSEARWRILSRLIALLPEPIRDVDESLAVRQSDGFTGADLKRCVEDARALYAYDVVNGRETKSGTAYLLEAAGGVKANKQRYADALAAKRKQ